MTTPSGPEQTNHRIRTTARVVAVLLLALSAFCFSRGIPGMQELWSADPFVDDPGPAPILWLAGGGFALVFALAAANVGFLRATASYTARETGDAVRHTASRAGVGWSEGTAAGTGSPEASGPFCRGCGTRNDGDAKFCDGCGQSLA